jgi:hypothetical protein
MATCEGLFEMTLREINLRVNATVGNTTKQESLIRTRMDITNVQMEQGLFQAFGSGRYLTYSRNFF